MEARIKENRWSKELEKPVYEHWKETQRYKFNKNSKKKVYSIDTPPPYVNSPVHMGHATTYILMDMFARYKRMKGHEVLFPLGMDRNGLPIEFATEKKFKISFLQTPREEFIKYCEKLLEQYSLESADTFLKSGISFNSWKHGLEIGDIYNTDSADYRQLTQETFIDLYKKDLIYEAKRINNYCPGCRTTIADAEITYEDVPSKFNDITFTVKETKEKITIGTTRPELIASCGMVIFNPEDARWKHLEGKTAITPIYNKEVPIKSHTFAAIEKGTGLVMMCSAGDSTDIRFFREMNLVPIISIDIAGRMNENAGFLKGLKVKEARLKIVEELKEKGLLTGQRDTLHRTPVCERSKDHIEFIEMSELYLKQIDFKDQMRKFAHQMNFYSPASRQIMLDWIDAVSIDWPISRRRYYATEVPLWYCEKCNHIYLPPKGKYYRPWQEKPPIDKCEKCGHNSFKGDTRVFDTWFDSSISPLYILKYERDAEFFKKNSPCSLRPQGKEIIRTWLYYTVLKDYLLTDKCIFEDVFIHHHILDESGKKMSKSLGNVINPVDIINKFGAEPLRLWAAAEGNLTTSDFRCSNERIEGASKTLSKLWNVSRFISMFPEGKKNHSLTELDKFVIQEVDRLIKYSDEKYAQYDFHNPATLIRNFIWETFASHYLELVKSRAYNETGKFTKEEQEAAFYTLNYCLDSILKILAPITPMITYKIYNDLRGKDIHSEEFPKVSEAHENAFTKEELMELNSAIWKAKKDAGKSLKDEIAEISVSEKFSAIEKDFVSAHNIKKIAYGEFSIKIQINSVKKEQTKE